ncbi:hypothetical protein Q9189_004543 [Teloschistes chrysophthalmus]
MDPAIAALEGKIEQADMQIAQTQSKIRDLAEFKETLQQALQALQAVQQHPLWNESATSHPQDQALKTTIQDPPAKSTMSQSPAQSVPHPVYPGRDPPSPAKPTPAESSSIWGLPAFGGPPKSRTQMREGMDFRECKE